MIRKSFVFALWDFIKWLGLCLLLLVLSLLLWWALSSHRVYKILFGLPLAISCGRVAWSVLSRPIMGFCRADAATRCAHVLIGVAFVGLVGVVLFGPPFWVRYRTLSETTPYGEYEATFYMRHHEILFGDTWGWDIMPKELRYEVIEVATGKVIMQGRFPGLSHSFGYSRPDKTLSVGGGGKLDWQTISLEPTR